jgi:NDP-sugar pyrophosphorylase family protein
MFLTEINLNSRFSETNRRFLFLTQCDLDKDERELIITVYPSIEKGPLGTADRILRAENLLRSHLLFVHNSAIISRCPFVEALKFHLMYGSDGIVVAGMLMT